MKNKGTIVQALVLAVAMCISCASAATPKPEVLTPSYNFTLKINGEQMEFQNVKGEEVTPFTVDGTIYAPVRGLAEKLGMEVAWDEESKTATVGQKTTEATMPATVQVEQGSLLGAEIDGIYTFKGIPYATAERFQMPQKAPPWSGLKAALVYGNICPNTSGVGAASFLSPDGPRNAADENCQYVNVWSPTLDTAAEKPVLVWIHGGAWTSGSSGQKLTYDGANLASQEDLVVVSLNHRVNVLGYTDLSAYGDEYKYSGNVGVADMVMALEWIRDNIEQFGGDPSNVTIMGQSGGGAKVLTLMGVPAAKGLFQKAICISGYVAGVDQAKAQGAGVELIEKVKETYHVTSDGEALALLKTMDYDDLIEVSDGISVGVEPVVDNDYYPSRTYDTVTGEMVDQAKSIPLMVTTTFAEMSGNIAGFTVPMRITAQSAKLGDPNDYLKTVIKSSLTDAQKDEILATKFGDNKEAAVQAFHQAYPDHDDVDAAYLDNSQLTQDSRAVSIIHSQKASVPVYRAVFAYEYPIFGGAVSWHTGADLPLIFNNLELMDYVIAGDESTAYHLANQVSGAVGSFARTGNPSQTTLAWPAYSAENSETMVFDRNSQVRSGHYDAEVYKYIPANAVLPTG